MAPGNVNKAAWARRYRERMNALQEHCRHCGVRYVYNRALAERSCAWTQEHRRITHAETDKMLTAWKQDPDTAWLTEPSKGPLQATLRNLQAAFVNFWQRRTKYPTFKKRGKTTDAATYFRNCFIYRNNQITLAKQDQPLRIVWSRPLPVGAEPTRVTVTRNSRGQYHVAISVETTVYDGPPTTAQIGIDAGITSLVSFSTGEKVINPRYEKRDRDRLALAQRRLAHKQKGSANRVKARVKVAKICGRITDRRKDFLHKLTTRLINENQVICIEDLSVRNMIKNHKLARVIADAGWSELRHQLEYKAEWYGRTVIAVDRFYPSSKTCSTCGAVVERLPLNIREWTCRCGASHDRDVNAAKVIMAAGLAVSACGDGVRPPRSDDRVGSCR